MILCSSQLIGFPALSQTENQNLALSLKGLTCSFHPWVFFTAGLPEDPPDHERDSSADKLIAFITGSSMLMEVTGWISTID